MRKFTALFLLALAMTIGANQAFAKGHGGSNDNGRSEQSRPDNDDDGGDATTPDTRKFIVVIQPVDVTRLPCLAGRRCYRKPVRRIVKKEAEDCSCVHKVMRVNGRFMPFIDCYQSIEVNGREQLRYCRNGNES